MKKILVAALLSSAIAAPAFAGDNSKMSIGAGYGFGNGGVLSLHGDYSLADKFDNKPITARVGWDHYSIDTAGFATYTWSYNVFYGGAYYDFGKELKMDHKIHPFAGLGFGFGSASCSGGNYSVFGATYNLCSSVGSPTVGGFYYIAGVQYDVTPKIAAEANFNGWGGLSLGANFKF